MKKTEMAGEMGEIRASFPLYSLLGGTNRRESPAPAKTDSPFTLPETWRPDRRPFA